MIYNKKKSLPEKIVIMLLLQALIVTSVQLSFSSAAENNQNTLSLERAIKSAQENDPWLVGNKHSQDAVKAMSVAAGTMPDPIISLGLANFPTDTFDINQEPMTQIKVGVTQMIPRGDSLKIKRGQLEVTSEQFPYQRIDRKAKVVVKVSQLWLDAYSAQESILLIEKDRPLFEQLADVVEASYSSALGKTRQQDLVRAQLELTRLDDRLTVLKQKKEMRVEMLSEWLSEYFRDQYGGELIDKISVNWSNVDLDQQLPDTKLLHPSPYSADEEMNPEEIYTQIANHPSIRALEKKIEASNLGIDLANQSYKPQWGLNASYGYRDDDQFGNDRADFLSVGVRFDLPFFTKNRQDKSVESAVSTAAAVKTQKWQLVRNMIAEIEKIRAQFLRLSERKDLYEKELLPQMHEQAEASLTAYTNDDGDFAEVVRARIAELNAQITALDINVEQQKAIIKLNYYFMESADDIISSNRHTGDMK